MNTNRTISLLSPSKVVFGCGCARSFADDAAERGVNRLFLLTSPPLRPHVDVIVESLLSCSIEVQVEDQVLAEPDIAAFERVLETGRDFGFDAVAGIGGGSVLDLAKLVAALHDTRQEVPEVFGIGNVSGRSTLLACLPTTSGTGSEVSPNAILLDEAEQLKKGVVSPFLVPDLAYVDPELTVSVPPHITAATGVDALTHCIEAYANKFAHPMIDLYALKGIKLIAGSLKRAVEDGADLEARTDLSLGSLYGGYSLGPVNTGAVHALAYPLGGEFHVAHGVSNAVLLPHVLEFNLPSALGRYADIAMALGADRGPDDETTALEGLALLRELTGQCGIPGTLDALGVPRDAVPRMAASALTVTRLLKNNVREVTEQDARAIYERAFEA